MAATFPFPKTVRGYSVSGSPFSAMYGSRLLLEMEASPHYAKSDRGLSCQTKEDAPFLDNIAAEFRSTVCAPIPRGAHFPQVHKNREASLRTLLYFYDSIRLKNFQPVPLHFRPWCRTPP